MIICSDVIDGLKTLTDGSVQCVVTSPPYWGLRDYGTATWDGGDEGCDHRQKPTTNGVTNSPLMHDTGDAFRNKLGIPYRDSCGKCGAKRIDAQLGLEPTPDEYVAKMVEVFRAVKRVLRDDGTLWLNLGDSYVNQATAVGPGGKKYEQRRQEGSGLDGGFRFSSRGMEADVQRAFRPNPQRTSLKPKDLVGIPWRVAFALQADGWYLRSDIIWAKPNPMPESVTDRPTKAHEYLFLLTKSERYFWDQEAVREDEQCGRMRGPAKHPCDDTNGNEGLSRRESTGGRNLRTVWSIPTQPYAEAHFATFPEKLVEPCVKAGSGAGDLVLDPFCGSGTVGVVALQLGREFIGIELSEEYCKLAERRIDAALQPSTYRNKDNGSGSPLFAEALA